MAFCNFEKHMKKYSTVNYNDLRIRDKNQLGTYMHVTR